MQYDYKIHISKNQRPIVAIDQFTIAPKKITFLFGESGIGKSLISKAIYGLIDPNLLDVSINDETYPKYLAQKPTHSLQKNGFFVFQEPSSHLNPLARLKTQLNEGSIAIVDSEQEILQKLWDDNDAAAQKILEVYPKPYRPSGGEKQRILLAMAFKKISLLQKKKSLPDEHLFVFDEPSGSLDDHLRNLFLQLLFEKFAQTRFNALFITHDYSIISEIYQQHREMAKHCAFKELTLADEGLRMRDFAPGEYLDWLKAEKSGAFIRGKRAKIVLSLKSGYEVFGKKMAISHTGNGKSGDELRIHAGKMVYVKAASGVGKTTLAKIIMGLQRCQHLRMTLCGQEFNDATPTLQWRRKVWGKTAGMVFQHADEALNLQATVREVFGGLPVARKLDDPAITKHLLTLFDIAIDDAFLSKKVALLSGGQKQRLNLLRTLALDTDLLILDEPLNGLDLESIQKVIGLLKKKLRNGAAILMISHNEEIIDSIVPPENVYILRMSR